MNWWQTLIVFFIVMWIANSIDKWISKKDERISDLEDRVSELEDRLGVNDDIEEYPN